MRMLSFIFCLLITFSVRAELLKPQTSGEVEILKSTFSALEILEEWARLKGINLSIDRSFPKKSIFHLRGKKSLSSEELDAYVTGVVGQSQFTLVTFPGSKLVKVISSRDVRYEPLPVYRNVNDVPENHSYAQMVYELKHIDPKDLARNLRPFLSRYGRVIDHSNIIYVADETRNLKRIGKIINFLDTDEYAKSLKRTEELNKKHEKVVKEEKSLIQILSEKEIIFLIIFFILGSIIGFGTRGYLMKRVEGGW